MKTEERKGQTDRQTDRQNDIERRIIGKNEKRCFPSVFIVSKL